MTSQPDTEPMRRALEAALTGPAADANPRVGAVVLDPAGEVVGVGHHDGVGSPHAEVVALDRAGSRARGGTAYITLEPCAHTGRTPPCTDALLDAGVRTVVYAASDPNPSAAGGGQVLAQAGVQVTGGVLAEQAATVLHPWAFAVRAGRPWVTWKLAATLDGRVAAADGTSAWVTSPQSRADVHRLRSRCGAVVVGTGTALADDPWLTVRHPDGTPEARQPLRVVVGRRALPEGARVTDGAARTLLLATHDPAEVLAELHRHEVRHALLEGGPTLAAAFWRAGLVDEVVAYLAPALLGAGRTAVGGLGISTIADIARLELREVARVGADVRITARPRPEEER